MGFPGPSEARKASRARGGRCYTSSRAGRPTQVHLGGTSIGEVIRRAWSRLVRKQWLYFYPLALAIINTLAFLAVYAAGGQTLRLNAFFAANFDRWQYTREQFFDPFSFTPLLAVAITAGLAVCVFAAMIRAPFFRAIVGPSYPLAPRKWDEAANLLLLYVFTNLVSWVLPLVAPLEGALSQLVLMFSLVISILVIFADYVIVFENLGVLQALRRSVQLLARRWLTTLLIFIVLQLVYTGVHLLYSLYYEGAGDVFILLPISQILVDSIIVMIADLVLIYLYEDIRRGRRA